jgi:uncharacterized membrane protein HdeD (DUF308 family)
MDMIIQALLSWQFVLLCLAIAALVYLVRQIVEYQLIKYNDKDSNLWNNLLLPILPIILGIIVGVFLKDPYPDVIKTESARIIFGLNAGFLSGLVYRVIKGTLISKVSGIESDEAQQNLVAQVRETINK